MCGRPTTVPHLPVVHLLLNRAAGDEAVNGDGPPLANAPSSLTSLAVSAADRRGQWGRGARQGAVQSRSPSKG